MADRPIDWREVVEDLAWQFAYRSHDASRKWLTTGGLSALEGAFEALGWDDPHYVTEDGCQHPGCAAWATSGAPTRDGYRRLCSDHYRTDAIALASPPASGERG